MFENKQINGYTYATRYIASWTNEGGKLRTGKDHDNFYEWLLSLGLNEEDAKYIKYLATNGKLELEISAKRFLKEHNLREES